jgi:hypothetical protein
MSFWLLLLAAMASGSAAAADGPNFTREGHFKVGNYPLAYVSVADGCSYQAQWFRKEARRSIILLKLFHCSLSLSLSL